MWVLRYVSSTGQLYPFRKATENLFLLFFRVPRQGVTKRKLADDLRDLSFAVSQTEYQSCSVCSPCSNQVRSTRTGPSFIKASFQVSENDDDSFRFLKTECSHHLMVPRQGNAITEMPASPHCFNLIIDNSS